jgi:ribonuclease R
MARQKRAASPDPYFDREKAKYEQPIPSREYILEVLRDRGRPLDRDELIKTLSLDSPDAVEALRRRLRAMERDGQVIRNRRGGYVIVDNKDLVRGRVTANADGWGFVRPDTGDRKVFLSPRQMRSLLHGDRVVVRVVGVDTEGRPEGELVEVLQRQNTHIVGRFLLESGVGFVVPDNKRIHHDVIVPGDQTAGAQPGQLVVAEVLEQPSIRRQPIGRIVQVLGDHIEAGMEIEVARRAHGIPTDWPEAVIAETANLGSEVEEAAKGGRVDLRQTPLVTIDGADARDFDDAVYCEPTENGWRLLVAIADVSHYVRPGTALDAEAARRATSAYFPRTVVPMLPEVLSNGLCSLNPQVDRLCMCCEMHIGPSGQLRKSRFFRGVMRSHARLTYEQAAAMLVEGNAELCAKYADLLPHLQNLYGVYKSLRAARDRRGAIDFETIEECMIAANVAAARHLLRHRIAALYRDHPGPDEDRLDQLRQFLAQLGLKLEGGDSPSPKDYARLMRKIGDRPDRHLIQTVLLRSMQAADYRPENIGHFGLALDAYAHFTSPIRRYPDLMVHRAIGHLLDGGKAEDYPVRFDEMVALGEHCSMADRRAEEASRDAMMTLKCQYMSDKLGQEFGGLISGVTSFGLFVELEDVFVDGLVHITNLENDYFHFDPIGHRLTGERTGKVYQLSDRVVVRVVRVDKDQRQIDFELVAHQSRSRGGKSEMKPVERRQESTRGRGRNRSGRDSRRERGQQRSHR